MFVPRHSSWADMCGKNTPGALCLCACRLINGANYIGVALRLAPYTRLCLAATTSGDCDDLPLVDFVRLLNVLQDTCYHRHATVRYT